MRYLLVKARDDRDGVSAWWLLRGETESFTHVAYMGAAPALELRGEKAAAIKRITIVRPDYYTFEDISVFTRCAGAGRGTVGGWETPA